MNSACSARAAPAAAPALHRGLPRLQRALCPLTCRHGSTGSTAGSVAARAAAGSGGSTAPVAAAAAAAPAATEALPGEQGAGRYCCNFNVQMVCSNVPNARCHFPACLCTTDGLAVGSAGLNSPASPLACRHLHHSLTAHPVPATCCFPGVWNSCRRARGAAWCVRGLLALAGPPHSLPALRRCGAPGAVHPRVRHSVCSVCYYHARIVECAGLPANRCY